MKRKDHPFSTTLPEELIIKLRHEGRKRRVPQKELMVSALKEFFDPVGLEADSNQLVGRLSRLEARQKGMSNKLEVLSETLALFIQVWFSNTYELPEEEKELASIAGEKRFSRFVEALKRRLER